MSKYTWDATGLYAPTSAALDALEARIAALEGAAA